MLKHATFASVFLLCFLESNIALAKGDFTKSCLSINLDNDTLLEGLCKRNNGRYSQSGINLNNYIVNVNGKLGWRRGGNYIETSRNCELDYQSGRTFLHCDTRKANNTWTASSLDLDRHIVNTNGTLRFDP
jgi:hypothetical protein